MPAIKDLQYGFDVDGVEEYIKDIKSVVLTQAADALDDLGDIKQACEKHWEGQARDDFLKNVEDDKEHVKEQFEALYQVLVGEITQAQLVMAEKDRKLID